MPQLIMNKVTGDYFKAYRYENNGMTLVGAHWVNDPKDAYKFSLTSLGIHQHIGRLEALGYHVSNVNADHLDKSDEATQILEKVRKRKAANVARIKAKTDAVSHPVDDMQKDTHEDAFDRAMRGIGDG